MPSPNRRTFLMAGTALAGAALLSGCIVVPARYPGGYRTAPRDPYDEDDAPYGPPPPQEEVYGPPPVVGYVWLGGFWNWFGGRHVWVPGRWSPPRPGYRWHPHRWQPRGQRWHRTPGHWQRERR